MRCSPDCRFNNLTLWLLLSCLLHGLAIITPHVFETWAEVRPVKQQAHNRQAVLRATLNHERTTITAASASSPPTKKAPAVPEPKPDALEPSLNFAEAPQEASHEETLEGLPLPDPVYFEASELTVKPQILGEPDLDSGNVAELTATGMTILALRINERGEVVDTSVDFSDLPEPFSQSAVRVFQNLRFVPGELNGKKVGAVIRIEVRYEDNPVLSP